MSNDSCKGGMTMAPSGDIRQMLVPWLFQCLRTASKTGTAVFEYIQGQMAEKAVKKIYFRNGDIVFAASNLEEDRLGDCLLRAGKITQVQFDASTEIVIRTQKKQGAVLVELGFISPPDLVAGVKLQVKQIVLGLFSVRMGTYRFEEGPLPVADIIPLQMSTGNVILDCINNLEWDAIRKSLPSPTTVIRPASDPSCLFQDAHLTPDQKTVFSLVDGKRSIEEICGLSGVGDFNAMKSIYLLLALRMAVVGEIKSSEEMEFAREAVQEAVRAQEGKKPETPAEKPLAPEVVVTRKMIRQAYEALAGQDHYQVLGVAADAGLKEIKHAYFRLAKSYHPDRHFDPDMADMKNTLEALFDGIHKAYTTLSDQAGRAEYDAARDPKPVQTQVTQEYEEKRAEEYQENYKEKAARALQQFNNGMKDFKVGNYWGAAEAFTWAVRLDPIKAPYFFFHGLSLTHIPRRRHEAEESLMKAVELDPTKVEYHIELGNLYLKSGVKAKALDVLNNALLQHPGSDRIKEAIKAAGGSVVEPIAEEKKSGVFKRIFKDKE